LGCCCFWATIRWPSWRYARDAWEKRLVEMSWKGRSSLVSLAGFAFIVWGCGLAREQPVLL